MTDRLGSEGWPGRCAVLALACAFWILGFACAPVAGAGGHLDAGLAFSMGFPQGEFAAEVDDIGYGLSGFVSAAPGISPFSFGADLGFLVYGQETRKEPFSTTIPDVTVDVTTSNNIVVGHLFVRFEPPTGPVRPYVDGLVGFKYLYTRTSIRSEEGHDDPIAESTNLDDTAFSYGVGGGLHLRLAQPEVGEGADGPRIKEVLLHLGARHLWGGEADYLKKGSIGRAAGGGVTYELSHSRTDLLLASLGVTVRL